jgi:diaminohydroxyphosphoribosylaminopyrimidine deaminase / 5-amino-6-(5-phosphoribosylamino)uracil reductase
VWLVHGPDASEAARKRWGATGAVLMQTPEVDGHLDLARALRDLAARGLTRILCEGGSTLAAALVRARLIDDLALFSGAALIGAEGHPALGPLQLSTLADAPRPMLRDSHVLGPDLYSLWSLA